MSPVTPATHRSSTVEVQDLRGVRVHAASSPVLLDVSGRRARRLRATGRVAGALFFLWFCGLVLAGLGLLPPGGLPLGSVVAPATAPPTLTRLPVARPASRADLTPAVALATDRTAGATGSGSLATRPSLTGGQSRPATIKPRPSAAKGPGKATPPARRVPKPAAGVTAGVGNGKNTGNGNGRPATTPGPPAAKTAPGTSAPPAKAKGKPATSPGRTKPKGSGSTPPSSAPAATTSPGSSGSAPGHSSSPPGNGKGNGRTPTTP